MTLVETSGMTMPVRSHDIDLAARLRAGDGSALELAYDLHSAAVFTVAHRISGSRGAAEELTQDVFLHLWERPERFDPERGGLRVYLTMLAHRRAVDRVRSVVAREAREERVHDATAAPVGTEEWALTNVESERARRWLQVLPVEQRRCIELAYFAGCTFQQVAEQMGIPEGTAKSRIRLALRRLHGALSTCAESVGDQRRGGPDDA